jgi:hypothetical protein
MLGIDISLVKIGEVLERVSVRSRDIYREFTYQQNSAIDSGDGVAVGTSE